MTIYTQYLITSWRLSIIKMIHILLKDIIINYILHRISDIFSSDMLSKTKTPVLLDYIPPPGFVKMWIVFMITIISIIFGEKLDTTLRGFMIALKMTLKFFMTRQSMDDVKFHEMHLITTKEETIQKTIYVILIGLYFGGDFYTNALIQRWYTLGTLDPMFTIVTSEVMVDFFFIWRIPYWKIWNKPSDSEEPSDSKEPSDSEEPLIVTTN